MAAVGVCVCVCVCVCGPAAVQSLLVYDVGNASADSSTIRSVENQPCHVRCVAVGGYPPPSLRLSVDRRDVTGEFALRSRATVSGRRGMRLMTYRSERVAVSFRPRADDHGARLKCVADVQGLKPVVEYAALDIDCESAAAPCFVEWGQLLNPVYTAQTVVKPVVQPAVQLYSRLDNRLHRVNKHPTLSLIHI